MIDVLLAVPDLAQEPDLVAQAGAQGLRVLRRCVDAVDLLAAAATDDAAIVVVSSGLPRLSGDVVDRLRAGRRLIALAADDADERILRRLGIDVVVHVGSTAEATLAALADRCGAATVPTAGHGVWPTVTQTHVREARAVGPDVGHGRVVAVWGPMGSPGRTTVAIALAEALAATGRTTCVVDADTYAPSVALALGVVEPASGLVVACRHADNGSLDAAVLRERSTRLHGSLHLLGGLPSADRWADLRPGALDAVWQACRSAFDVTVVDVGFCLEDDDGAFARRRNAAALTAVAVADRVVAVADATPAGAARLAAAWPAVGSLGDVVLVRNRARGRDRAWLSAVRAGGVTADPHDVPADPRALADCWRRGRTLGEGARRSRIRHAADAVAASVVSPWILASR